MSAFPNIAVIQNLNLASQELPFAEGLSSGDAAALVAKHTHRTRKKLGSVGLLECQSCRDSDLSWFDRMNMAILNSIGWLTCQPGGIPIGDVWVLGVEQIEDIKTEPHWASFPVCSQIDESCALRALRSIFDQWRTGEMSDAGRYCDPRREPCTDPTAQHKRSRARN